VPVVIFGNPGDCAKARELIESFIDIRPACPELGGNETSIPW